MWYFSAHSSLYLLEQQQQTDYSDHSVQGAGSEQRCCGSSSSWDEGEINVN